MDIQLLKAFIATAETGSISLAAEQLHLTQSAMSKRIAQLESSLGVSLFDRVGRSIQLREAGKALVPRAKKILQEVADTKQFMKDMEGSVSGLLSIATSHHIGIHRLPDALKTYTSTYPEVRLQLNFIDSEQAIDTIIHGDYELGLITLPEAILNHQITAIEHLSLWQDTMEFVVNHNHPLAQKSNIQLQDLAQYPAILPDANTYTTQLISQLFTQSQQALDIAMSTNHLDAIKMMISVGLGWSVLPETLINSPLVKLTLGQMSLSRQLGVIYHRERTLSNSAKAMLQVLLSL